MRQYFSLLSVVMAFSLIEASQSLEKKMSALLNRYNHLHIGCEVYSFKQQKIIYSYHANQLFTPGSNTKLFTCLFALDLLGEAYRFQTSLLTDGTISGSTLKGNLYLQSSGDPSLTTDDLKVLFNKLIEKGITTITGNIYVDRTVFDGEYFAPGTTVEDIGRGWMSPLSGFMVDRKPVTLCSADTAYLNKDITHCFFEAVPFVNEQLSKLGVGFDGTLSFAQCPEQATLLASYYSDVLSQLITKTLKSSDNLYADCLFKKMSTVLYGFPGSWANGTKAMGFFSEAIELEHPVILRDGSGLSRYNLVSPHDIVSLLVWATAQVYFLEFMQTLPIAGVDGTLLKRMLPIASQVKAKTGTLGGVSALSGYLETEDDMFAFSIMINGYSAYPSIDSTPKKEIEDALCLLLAESCSSN